MFFLVLYAVFNVLTEDRFLSSFRALGFPCPNGDGEIRTHDPLLARQVLSQLSYTPVSRSSAFLTFFCHGDDRHLFYMKTFQSFSLCPVFFLKMIRQPPALPCRLQHSTIGRLGLNRRVRDGNGCFPQTHRHRNLLTTQQHDKLYSYS